MKIVEAWRSKPRVLLTPFGHCSRTAKKGFMLIKARDLKRLVLIPHNWIILSAGEDDSEWSLIDSSRGA
jgi:hypothetical protein